MTRTGIGYDVHQLAIGEKLIIAGVTIPAPFGSVGHSDGDVLIHALVDALLGAASLGDIGKYFPSESGKWRGASSNHFLVESVKIVEKSGFEICNVDTTIILQKPKIKRFIPQIKKNLTYYMNVDKSRISVKTTTTDYLGFIGDGNGWAALAVATLFK
tara:strand:- start:884 stop:1357 length:474 start_codon:yes stop_codon:yes gene_type:complete